ncbi:MAG: Npun_R2821/Npun_R2822 family protein [Pleurocapsa sp.]
MSRGIYITANDRVTDHAIALMNSIRFYDSDVPVVMIPYDDNYLEIAKILGDRFGVNLYPDLDFIERLSQQLYAIFGSGFFARPNQFRKQACWFGEFDEFLYIDTDIVVFEKIIDNLDYLQQYDFLCCDYQHSGGIKNVFSQIVIEQNIFTESELQSIFNGGFWASKKNLISEQDLYDTFNECAAHPEYFDFTQKTSDQPIINYMILQRIPKRFNLVYRDGKAPGSWAGSEHFQQKENILFDPNINKNLQYLHWAGIKIQPGCSYWNIWKHYRYLNEIMPTDAELSIPKNQGSILQQLTQKMKKKLLSK